MKKALFLNTNRNGYGPEQCGRTMTVGELISLLEDFDSDREIFLRNDDGYTYGSIVESDFVSGKYDNDNVEIDEEW